MINNPHSIFEIIKSIHKLKTPPRLECSPRILKYRNTPHNNQRLNLYRNSSIGVFNNNRGIQLPSLIAAREIDKYCNGQHKSSKGKGVNSKANKYISQIRQGSILGSNEESTVPFYDDDSSSNIQPVMIDNKIDFIKTHLQLMPSTYNHSQSRNKRIKVTGGNINLEDIADGIKTSYRTKLVERNGLVFYEFDNSKQPLVLDRFESEKTLNPSDLRNHPKTIELIEKFSYSKMRHNKWSADSFLKGGERVCLNKNRTYRNLQCILYKRTKYHQEGTINKGHK